MSGIFKAIGKVFKAVVKVIKKVALPVLAIGAVVLTGGAALGVLPSVGGLAGSLGLSPALTGVLTTAAKGATMGAVTSAVTGGNILKGATSGFAIGGALGAAGTMMNRGVSAASQAGSIASTDPINGVDSIISPNSPMQGFNPTTAMPAASGAANAGIGAGLVGNGGIGGGGLLGWMERNPIMAGSLVQGIGNGLMASEQAKAVREAEARSDARYAGYNGIGPLPTVGTPSPVSLSYIQRDPNTGRIVQKAN